MTVKILKTVAGTIALLATAHFTVAHAQTEVSPAEARAIAKEAYVYGYPIVDNYRIQYAYFVDRNKGNGVREQIRAAEYPDAR
jgi:hypothetical protein